MKRQGSKFEYEAERNKELLKAYCYQVEICSEIRLDEILSRVVNTPCSRFWVSDERASIVMSGIERGTANLDSMIESRKEMFLEIYDRVKALRINNPTMSLSELTNEVVKQPAPRFYLTAKSARTIIHRIRKQWRITKKRPF